MCEDQSSPRTNNPALESPPGSSAHAGFADAQPQGATTSQAGPILTGWPRRVGWNEFREISSRPAGATEDGQIDVILAPIETLVFERESGQFKFGDNNFRLIVNREASWVVSDQKSPTLLAHEQGHYDIGGLCYRDFVDDLRRLRENSRRMLVREMRRLVREHDARGDTLSRQYDAVSETNHGTNADRQLAWQQRIQECIRGNTRLTAPL